MNSTVKIVTGFLLGSITGLIAGLLVAPTTGKKARNRIGKKSKKLARKIAGFMRMQAEAEPVAAKRKNSKPSVEA